MRLIFRERADLLFSEPFGDGVHRQAHVRAASAIVRFGDGWLLAQDDSNFAARWDSQGIRPLRLFPDTHGDTYSSALGNKKHKPDLECGTSCMVAGRQAAIFFGSGSTPARRRAAVVRDAEVAIVALDSLYESAEKQLDLAPGALNLEGAATVGEAVRFFQRGNGPGGVNATFDVEIAKLVAAFDGSKIGAEDLENVRRYDLGTLGGAPLGFSAADALSDGRVLFAASAEASPNTYDDGACAGSVIGLIAATGAVERILPLPPELPAGLKIEGLAVVETLPDGWRLVAVTDADDPATPSARLLLDCVG